MKSRRIYKLKLILLSYLLERTDSEESNHAGHGLENGAEQKPFGGTPNLRFRG
jgi:hypothetical protein